jgi:hypothetical protein
MLDDLRRRLSGCRRRSLDFALKLGLIRLSPPFGNLENGPPSMIVRGSPFLDFLQGTKTTQARIVIVQAAIANTGG